MCTKAEKIRIGKPLTLRGAGWRKTVITSPAAADVLVVSGVKEVVIEGVKVVSRAPRVANASGTGSVVAIRAAEMEAGSTVQNRKKIRTNSFLLVL